MPPGFEPLQSMHFSLANDACRNVLVQLRLRWGELFSVDGKIIRTRSCFVENVCRMTWRAPSGHTEAQAISQSQR